MLYILPPPSSPSPPSPWPNILCNKQKKDENLVEKAKNMLGGKKTDANNNSGNAGSNSDVVSGKLLYRQFVKKRSGNGGTSSVIQKWLNSVQQNSMEKNKKFISSSRSNNKNSTILSDSGAGSSLDEDEQIVNSRSLDECYFAGKTDSSMIVTSMENMCQKHTKCKERHYHHYHSRHHHHHSNHQTSSSSSSSSRNGSPSIIVKSRHRRSANGCDIQQHLQSMFCLLRPGDTLKMAVKLESAHAGRTRYLVVVSCVERNQREECCLLGIDCNQRTTVGLVLKVLADTTITLDGDGGFSVSVCGRQHIFKPVSVQAMWSALQTLHKVSSKAGEYNYFEGGVSHEWVSYYEERIKSDRSCLNEWHAMNDLESRRPPSPDSLRSKPRERFETEKVIRNTLKEIMMSVDLDEVTSKYIRTRLEEQLDMDLREYKSFIDQEMLIILGQMDAATEVFPHVYLGSEWNASNLEELNRNGVHHILNVTREIDNFFPGMFDYLNIRVYDDDNTDLLKHWDNTYKYINKAKKDGSKVLVHCKMGISRSASVVIAYAMKAYNWDLNKAFDYVRKKRSCIKPNENFVTQLETYQGMLDAMKNKEKLQRSKSETNLKSTSNNFAKRKSRDCNDEQDIDTVDGNREKIANGEETDCTSITSSNILRVYSGSELAKMSLRPKSWSPDNLIESEIFNSTGTISQSLEHLSTSKSYDSQSSSISSLSTSPPNIPPAPPLPPVDIRYYNSNVRMPCSNGLTYSVSQNKIVQLYSSRYGDSDESAINSKSEDSYNDFSKIDGSPLQQSNKQMSTKASAEFELNNSCSVSKSTASVENLPPIVPPNLVKKDTWTNRSCDSSSSSISFSVESERASHSNIAAFRFTATNGNKLDDVAAILCSNDSDNGSLRMLDDRFVPSENVIINDKDDVNFTAKSITRPLDIATKENVWSDYNVNSEMMTTAVPFGYRNTDSTVRRNSISRHSSWGSSDTASTKYTLSSYRSNWGGSYELNGNPGQQQFDHNADDGTNSNRNEWYPTVNNSKRAAENDRSVLSLGTNPPQRLNHYSSSPVLSSSSSSYILPSSSSDNIGSEYHFSTTACSQPNIVTFSAIDNTASSPSIVCTTQCSSVRHQTDLLERLHNAASTIIEKQTTYPIAISNSSSSSTVHNGNSFNNIKVQNDEDSHRGIVLNLKKEFEAKCQLPPDKQQIKLQQQQQQYKKNQEDNSQSLPSSPVSEHADQYSHSLYQSALATNAFSSPQRGTPPASIEDLSVRQLVGKYEVAKCSAEKLLQQPPPIPPRKYSTAAVASVEEKKSFVEKLKKQGTIFTQNNRNASTISCISSQQQPVKNTFLNSSVIPDEIKSTVTTKAANKLQQNKTRPLSKITFCKPRLVNSAYNTM